MKITNFPQPAYIKEIAEHSRTEKLNTNRKDSFRNVLNNTLNEKPSAIKFSAHAVDRLTSRSISLTQNDISKIENAVEQLEQKGSKESLVMMGNLALLVSVKNNTVITALDSHQNNTHNIFTNIDSAFIM